MGVGVPIGTAIFTSHQQQQENMHSPIKDDDWNITGWT